MSFEFSNTEVISKSKPVEWLGLKSDWCERDVNGWGVGKEIDNSFEMFGSGKKKFFFKKKIKHCEC